jgi:hypothetical protein
MHSMLMHSMHMLTHNHMTYMHMHMYMCMCMHMFSCTQTTEHSSLLSVLYRTVKVRH